MSWHMPAWLLILQLFRRFAVIGKNLFKHIREFQRYVRNYNYEWSADGIYFANAHAWLRGAHTHWVTGYESEIATDCNVIPYEGQGYVLKAALTGEDTAITSWYLGLHSGTGAEDPAATAATYNATYSEIQAQSGDPGGYTSATRIAWANDNVVVGTTTEVTNDTTPAAFTVDTSTTLVVNGAWFTDKSGRTDYTGVAVSITKFAATRNLADTDVFNLKYKIDLDHV
jgi:hypothetical protein